MLTNRKLMFGARGAVAPDLRINGVGVQEHMDPYIIDRLNGSGDLLLMVFHSDAVVLCGAELQQVSAGSAVLWKQGSRQMYGNSQSAFNHSWMHFDGAWARETLRAVAIPVDTPFVLPEPSTVDSLLLLICSEILDHHTADGGVVRGLVSALLHAVGRQWKHPDPGPEPPARLMEARKLIETHYADRIDLARLAETACLSVPQFCSQFKRFFGLSAIHYLVQVRLEHALHLLRNRNMPIAHVGFSVGFSSLSHFSATFRKRYGEGPRAVRRKLLGER